MIAEKDLETMDKVIRRLKKKKQIIRKKFFTLRVKFNRKFSKILNEIIINVKIN